MTSNSKYFDRIRVKKRTVEPEGPRCQWRGCSRTGTHRAPKGRGHEGEYHVFCVDHVRDYNKTYNYFDGMADDAVARFQKDTITGHRPTWTLGANGAGRAGENTTASGPATAGLRFEDPMTVFADARTTVREAPRAKPVSKAARKAFEHLGLDPGTAGEAIKAKYKLLVKRHHPDANGGTRDAEDRLVEIIQAYRYLRSAGFC